MEVLGVGRTPLRTALSRLQSDGLVIATPEPRRRRRARAARVGARRSTRCASSSSRRCSRPRPRASPTAQLSACASCCDRMEACRRRCRPPSPRAHREFHTVERATLHEPVHRRARRSTCTGTSTAISARALVRTRDPIDFLRLDRETVDALEAGDGCARGARSSSTSIDAAISFLADADVNHQPAMLVAVARANGIDDRDRRGRQRAGAGARSAGSCPCPTLPPLRTPHLVYEPDGARPVTRTRPSARRRHARAPAPEHVTKQDVPVIFGISGAIGGGRPGSRSS